MVRTLALSLYLLLALAAAPPVEQRVCQKPIGADMEGSPPFSRTAAVTAWQKAYYCSQHDEAERIARAIKADPRRAQLGGPFASIEAHFILGQVLGSAGLKTEAEGEYREGLALLVPLVGAQINPAKLTEREKQAREWARFFEAHLQMSVSGQGRIREADALVSIIPKDLAAVADASAAAERVGIGGMVGIATDVETGNAGGVALTADQSERRWTTRQRMMAAARAQDSNGYYAATRDLLAFDEPLAGPMGVQTGYDLTRLSEAAFALGRHREAQQLAGRAVAIFERHQYRTHDFADALAAQSNAMVALGEASQAEPLLRRALALPGLSTNPYLLINLAANLFGQGRLTDSEEQYRKAAAQSGLDTIRRDEVRIFAAYLASKRGDLPRAQADYRSICADLAERTAQTRRGSRATSGPVLAQDMAADCALRQTISAWLWHEQGGGNGVRDTLAALRDEAFVAAQRTHSDSAAAALAQAGARAVAARSGLAGTVDAYEAAIRERDAIGAAPPEDWFNPSYTPVSPEQAAQRERLNASIAEMAGKLANAAPRFWDLRTPRPLDITALQAKFGPDALLLHQDEALISFMIPPDQRWGLVFAVSKDKTAWARLPFTRAELLTRVNSLRAAIDPRAYGTTGAASDGQIGFSDFDRQSAWELYRDLFGDPAIQAVIGPKPVWMIVPDGPLTSLPPALLLTAPPEGGVAGDADDDILRQSPWLVRSKAVAFLPSVAALRTIRQILPIERRIADQPLVALVDPDFSPGAANPEASAAPSLKSRSFQAVFRDGVPDVAILSQLKRLAHAKEEGLAIKQALHAGDAALLSGAGASKAALMALNSSGALARARVIEFATHGFAAGEGDGVAEPMLVLAAAERPVDWVLRASDAAGLRLNADWVVLSGCNTASPDLGKADGISGFARAFFFAGASSLLVSHWRLDDEIAAKMVPATLKWQVDHKGESKAEALRQAMLAILDDTALIAAHPAFWAPFTLIGEVR